MRFVAHSEEIDRSPARREPCNYDRAGWESRWSRVRAEASASRSPAPSRDSASSSTSPTSTAPRPRRPPPRSARPPGVPSSTSATPRVAAVSPPPRRSADRSSVWVNNAGVLVTGHVWEHDEALRRTLFEVNSLGTINGSLAALEQMRPADSGHLINVVSLAGLAAPPGEALYAATKHAAMAFTLGTLADLRRSGSKNINVSAVCPDGIWTPMLFDKLDDRDAAPSFSGVLMRPETVAEAVAGLVDKPRVVLTIPRYRGLLVRLFDMAARPRDPPVAVVAAGCRAPPARVEAEDRERRGAVSRFLILHGLDGSGPGALAAVARRAAAERRARRRVSRSARSVGSAPRAVGEGDIEARSSMAPTPSSAIRSRACCGCASRPARRTGSPSASFWSRRPVATTSSRSPAFSTMGRHRRTSAAPRGRRCSCTRTPIRIARRVRPRLTRSRSRSTRR